MSVAIFPAAGGLGGATYSALLKLLNPKDVVLISRHPEKLQQEQKAGATVRKADFDDVESLKGVFEGVKTLNLISYPSIEHEHRFEVAKAAIDSARASGVQHIFYSSLAFGGFTSNPPFRAQVMLAHLDTEAYLRSIHEQDPGKLSYTVVRVGLYSESFPIYTASFDINHPPKDGKIRVPHNGEGPGIAWAKREELGEAVARLIAIREQDPENFAWKNKLMVLSGPKAYSLNETAKVFSDVLGREITVQEVSVDEYADLPAVKESLTYGSGSWSRPWATAFEGLRHGVAAEVTPYLRELLGREPEAFEVTVRGMKASV
ncbi:hypothetical protein QFC21_003026 [Naganishia friedmannii]|uniref:Uncharacterized protein n=1 Tax=Naganishia friedmannii TaxID=89922 RepID=A0ACC2VRF3_9TREE|nr:hypothetical protein QFC21_003026 [Naganishia friedmannii]